MQTFDFPYHKAGLKYPDNSGSVQLGKGYTFVGRPVLPAQRIYTLSFPAMWWILDANGDRDDTTDPQRNIGALENFYAEHQLYEKFIYPGHIHGNVVVRFTKPLEIPEPLDGGLGRLPSFTIELTEQP